MKAGASSRLVRCDVHAVAWVVRSLQRRVPEVDVERREGEALCADGTWYKQMINASHPLGHCLKRPGAGWIDQHEVTVICKGEEFSAVEPPFEVLRRGCEAGEAGRANVPRGELDAIVTDDCRSGGVIYRVIDGLAARRDPQEPSVRGHPVQNVATVLDELEAGDVWGFAGGCDRDPAAVAVRGVVVILIGDRVRATRCRRAAGRASVELRIGIFGDDEPDLVVAADCRSPKRHRRHAVADGLVVFLVCDRRVLVGDAVGRRRQGTAVAGIELHQLSGICRVVADPGVGVEPAVGPHVDVANRQPAIAIGVDNRFTEAGFGIVGIKAAGAGDEQCHVSQSEGRDVRREARNADQRID